MSKSKISAFGNVTVFALIAVFSAFLTIIGCNGKGGNPAGVDGPYKLTAGVTPAGTGTVLVDPEPDEDGKYANGTVVTVTARAVQGFLFSAWSGASMSGDSVITLSMNGNRTLTAHFEPQVETGDGPYALTTGVTPDGTGTVLADPEPDENGEYAKGTVVTVKARAVQGFVFTAWSGASVSTDSVITITMNGPRTLTAAFKQQTGGDGDNGPYLLTTGVTPAGAGAVLVDPEPDANGKYAKGTVVTATARAEEGFVFDIWSGASVSTDSVITITMNGVRTLTAAFEPAPQDTGVAGPTGFTLAVAKNPAVGGGTVTVSVNDSVFTAPITRDSGTMIDLRASAASGYVFVDWTVTTGNSVILYRYDTLTTLILRSNSTVTANFSEAVSGYRTVKIGNRIWMAENLAVETSTGSWCHTDSYTCNLYGRWYTWDAAVSACDGIGGGWRLPTTADWYNLADEAGGFNTGGQKLKSQNLWLTGSGTDELQFSALPGGYYDGAYQSISLYGNWWSAADLGVNGGYFVMSYNSDKLEESHRAKNFGGYSVRCVRDAN